MNPAPPRLRRIPRALLLLLLLLCFTPGVFPQAKPETPGTPQVPGAAPAPAVKERLSAKDRKEVFEKVWKEIHDHYYDPSYNGVDWNEVHQRYAPLVETTKRDQEFYALMSQMSSELHDAHTRF